MELVRKPAVAGMFYPGSANELNEQLEYLFAKAATQEHYENIAGIIAPHAGYVYSGLTAAKAYVHLKDKSYKNVFVISPSHREYFRGISIYPGDYYETPLGKIKINKDLSNKLTEAGEYIYLGHEGHRGEHALEVHLPFLQKTLNQFELIPIVMGDQAPEFINDLATALAKTIDDESLVVASSDLSHFYDKDTANRLDSVVAEHINNFNYEELIKDLEARKCEACGGGPMAALMKALAAKGKNNSKVIARSDSGDVSGDNSEVVGYLSAIVY